jgi:hypothetical protein
VSPGFRHRTPDVRVLSLGGGLLAFGLFVEALHPLAFTLRSGALALVGIDFPAVGRLLALVRELIPLVGEAVAFISDPLTPRKLAFAAPDRLLALTGLIIGAATEFTSSAVTILGDHALP